MKLHLHFPEAQQSYEVAQKIHLYLSFCLWVTDHVTSLHIRWLSKKQQEAKKVTKKNPLYKCLCFLISYCSSCFTFQRVTVERAESLRF